MSRSRIIKPLCASILLFSVIISFSSCRMQPKLKLSFAMGSTVSAKIYTEDDEKANEIFEAVNSVLNDTEKALSATKKTSEIYKLNNNRVVYVSDYLKKILVDSLRICSITDRQLDISIGKATSLWGFNTDEPSVPDEETLKAAVDDIDLSKIIIDSDSNKVTLKSDIEIDLGAFGKGAACDAIYEKLKYKDIPMTVSVGGSVLVLGKNPAYKIWSVGIRNPFEEEYSCFATLELTPDNKQSAVFISTSGSYEKSFTADGKDYHHILDPSTGYPVEGELISVTVVASSGIIADSLSTAFFINGLNDNIARYLELFDCEAVFLFKDKTYFVTEGLDSSIKKIDSAFSPREFSFSNEK